MLLVNFIILLSYWALTCQRNFRLFLNWRFLSVKRTMAKNILNTMSWIKDNVRSRLRAIIQYVCYFKSRHFGHPKSCSFINGMASLTSIRLCWLMAGRQCAYDGRLDLGLVVLLLSVFRVDPAHKTTNTCNMEMGSRSLDYLAA